MRSESSLEEQKKNNPVIIGEPLLGKPHSLKGAGSNLVVNVKTNENATIIEENIQTEYNIYLVLISTGSEGALVESFTRLKKGSKAATTQETLRKKRSEMKLTSNSVSFCVKQNKPCIYWVNKYLLRDELSFGLGILGLLCSGVAEIPQIITNFRTKSCKGVSLILLFNWIVGDIFNLVGSLLEPITEGGGSGVVIGHWLGWMMAVVYMGGRVPQIVLNIKRKSVEGLNPLMFVFALIANATYVGRRFITISELKSNFRLQHLLKNNATKECQYGD